MTSILDKPKDDFEPYVAQERSIPQKQGAQDDFTPYDFGSASPKKEKPPIFQKALERSINPFSALPKETRSQLADLFTISPQKKTAEEKKKFAKGFVSGTTAGISEAVPGMDVEPGISGTLGKVGGSIFPIGAGAKLATKALQFVGRPLYALAQASPKAVKAIDSLANIFGLSAAGGLYEGLEESAQKSIEANEFIPPSLETVAKEGAKWGALDVALRGLGWGGRFAKALFEKSKSLDKPVMEVLTNVTRQINPNEKKIAEKAFDVLEEMKAPTQQEATSALNEQVQQRVKNLDTVKVSPQEWNKLEASSVPEPYLPAEFEAETIAEDLLSEDLTRKIEGTAQRAPTEKELGENIKKDIERTVEENKKKTDALYEEAKEGMETKQPALKQTADSIVEQLKKIEGGGLNLTPEGYQKAKRQLIDSLTDLGYAAETGANGLITGAIEHTKIPLSQAIDVKKRMNKLIDYDLLDTGAQDFLKDPVAKLRQNIREGFGPEGSKSRKAFEKAEKDFGEFAEKKGKRSIRGIRSSEKPESIATLIKTPSGLEDVKSMVSKEQFAQVERELLEYLRGQTDTKAAEFYREIRPSLSADTRTIAEEIIASKAPKGSATRKIAQREAIQKKAVEDLVKSTITGERPKVALDLWKTKEGQLLIKDALENNPNKKEVLKYLSEQSFKDFASSVVGEDGLINFKEMNNLMKDKATVDNIRLVAGEDGVQFFRNLEQMSKRVQKNQDILERAISKGNASERAKIQKEITKRGEERFQTGKQKRQEQAQSQKTGLLYKLDDLVNSYKGIPKALLSLISAGTIGFGTTAEIAVGYEVLSRLAKSKKLREAVKKAAIPHKTPANYLNSIMNVANESES